MYRLLRAFRKIKMILWPPVLTEEAYFKRINIETRKPTKCKVIDLETLSLKQDVAIKSLPMWLR